jgi:divalent metal cation (Fe/Co/Zn/Cd) transporter
MTATTTRTRALARAQRLAAFTIAWNLAEGAIAIAAAIAAGSRALIGFGLDSAVESISATVLLWRLGAERRDPDRADAVERVATRAIGVSFVLLAAFVSYDAIRSLASGDEPDTAPAGIAVTALSLVVMPVLARRKRRVATALGSRAARADSAQTSACAWLSAVVLAGLAANAALGWWWADPVAALGVVVLLLNEAREALSAEHLDDCC